MKHKSTPILEVHVETDPEGTVMLASEIGSVKMIPFKGTVTGPIFNGIVEPCGVDTQIINQNEVRHMSARYMLTGQDKGGRNCHIYVENNGWFTDGARPAPFRTVPTQDPTAAFSCLYSRGGGSDSADRSIFADQQLSYDGQLP